MEKGIERLVELIYEAGGSNPLVFFDSGAVIHFENELHKNENRHLDSKWLYAQLRTAAPIYVCEDVMAEICRHHSENVINRRQEISEDTHFLMSGFHNDYCTFLKSLVSQVKSFDTVRYDVFHAGNIAEKLRARVDHKKDGKEGLSRTDMQALSTAIWARYASIDLSKPTSASMILTTDELIKRTANLMCDQSIHAYDEFGKFGYDNIKVIRVDA